jgi:hypothetical protein
MCATYVYQMSEVRHSKTQLLVLSRIQVAYLYHDLSRVTPGPANALISGRGFLWFCVDFRASSERRAAGRSDLNEVSGRDVARMNRDAGSSRLAGPSIGTLSVVDSDVVCLRIAAGWHHISAITMVDGFSDLPAAILGRSPQAGQQRQRRQRHKRQISSGHHLSILSDTIDGCTSTVPALSHLFRNRGQTILDIKSSRCDDCTNVRYAYNATEWRIGRLIS